MKVDWMEMLDLGDSRMRVDRESVEAVAALLRRARPRLVLAPYPRDPHPDHARSGRIVAEAVHVAGLRNYPLAGEPFHAGQLAYCMYRAHFRPSFVVDVTEQFVEKRRAVLAYHSQVGATKEGEEESRLSSPLFLQAWEGRHLHFGASIGVRYGEAYHTEYTIPLEDPAAAFAIPQQRRIAVEGPA
jgi:LmbE family N-acetylglucosaminyl deacetylase